MKKLMFLISGTQNGKPKSKEQLTREAVAAAEKYMRVSKESAEKLAEDIAKPN